MARSLKVIENHFKKNRPNSICFKFWLGYEAYPKIICGRPGSFAGQAPVSRSSGNYRPVKLFYFPFQMGVSKVLIIVPERYQLNKQKELY